MSAEGKAESEEEEYHPEDDIFKDLERTAPVPSRQRMIDFTKVEKHSGKVQELRKIQRMKILL